jgi:hypothetical protein
MKRQWETPLLVSLTRGGPGEAILSACKTGVDQGAFNNDQSCHQAPNLLCEERARTTRVASGVVACMECSDLAQS